MARLSDRNPSVRGWALKLIDEKKAVELAAEVNSVLENDEDPEVRYDALTTLVKLKGVQAVELLVRVLREEGSALVREGAVRCCALVSPPTPLTGDVLIRALRDKDQKVRDTAATLLRKGFDQYFAFDAAAPPAERHKAIRDWRNWYEANKNKLKWNEEKRRFDPTPPRPDAEGEPAGGDEAEAAAPGGP